MRGCGRDKRVPRGSQDTFQEGSFGLRSMLRLGGVHPYSCCLSTVSGSLGSLSGMRFLI